MRLTRLEIYGFKSFAKRTEIVFPQNVTGIVGPNGSGKSNIGDAVRWVLGEQSAKMLRGNSMADVIFNGTEKRKPLNYCEVTLVFDNTDHQLQAPFDEVSITRRVYRSGVPLLATPSLVLQIGDRVIVVGEAPAVHNVEKVLGNAEKNLNEPNIAAIFIGIILGLAVGAVPLHLPGISAPVRLGLAGGPIIVGILIGTFGPRLHMITYTTLSANLMLRGIGLSMYLACLGLDAGAHFFDTVMRPEGAMWIGLGFALTLLPVLVMGWIALRWSRLDFGSTCGMLCGALANPMALGYANDTIEGDNPSVSYATVYPLSMFVRVILAQVVLLFFR